MRLDDFLPRWTERVEPEPGGRDPLGLSRVSAQLVEWLLPGIVTNTPRARYFSLFTWILWDLQRCAIPPQKKRLTTAFRRRDAFIALATMRADPDSSPVGYRVVRHKLQELKGDTINIDFRTLPARELGGLEQYYVGSLQELGLVRRDGNFFRVTEDQRFSGQRLAEAVHQSVKQTTAVRRSLLDEPIVPLAALDASSRQFSINAIKEPFAQQERDLLRKIFFSEIGVSQHSRNRPQTLGLILFRLKEYADLGQAVPDPVDLPLLISPAFHGLLLDPSGQPSAIAKVPPFDQPVIVMWQQFALHQMVTRAIEDLFSALLKTTEPYAQGLSPEDIVKQWIRQGFQAALEEAVGAPSRAPYQLMAGMGLKKPPDAEKCQNAQADTKKRTARRDLSLLFEQSDLPAPEMAARAVHALAHLYPRWRHLSQSPEISDLQLWAGPNLWAATVLPGLDRWFQEDLDWNKALKLAIEDWLVQPHERVASEKGNQQHRWIDLVGPRIVKLQDLEPPARASRWNAALGVLRDLDLVRFENEKWSIARDGKTQLDRLLRNRR